MRYEGTTRQKDRNSAHDGPIAKALVLLTSLALGCSGTSKEGKPADSELGRTTAFGKAEESDPEEPVAADEDAILPLGEITKTSFREHPAGKAWVMAPGEEPVEMDIGQAEARGYTIVDLSNGWTPYIFTEKTPGTEDTTKNKYRQKYIGLANDQIDSDGDALPSHGHNYLELYGIPPSLSVIKAEWDGHDDDVEPCLEEAGFDPEVFTSFEGKIVYKRSGQNKRNRTARMRRARLAKAMRKAKLKIDVPEDLEAAATNPATKSAYESWRAVQAEVDVIDHAQRRFRCEQLFTNGKDGRGKFDKAVYDSATTHALANFERKHDLMGWGHFKRDNLDTLALTPDQASHERLLRVLTERVVTSAGIIEDGSAGQWKRGKFRYKDTDGNEHALRDVVTEFSGAAVEALGLQTPDSAEAALARLSDLGEGNFENLLVAIKMPEKPAYYSDNVPEDLEAAATNPATKSAYESWRAVQAEVDVIDHAQRRFRCEQLFTNGKDGRGKFDKAVYDSATTHALANFERKHDLMGWGHFKRDNLDTLALTPDQASHERLLRVLTERVVTSAGIIEDGSAGQWKRGKFRYKDTDGNEHALRDVVTEFSGAAVEALGMQTPDSAEAALARLSDLGEGNFENLLVAIKMPEKPAYYSDNMRFSAVIDRGDVWYEFPYSDDGKKKSQPRSRYPHLTLYVHYADQKIPLVHWRTTIGAWRNEFKDGQVMLKYKNSDVGDRVWKDIVAAPVWIPPPTTPPAELIKGKWKNGKFRRGVNYDEIGPGFRSAYGLVAAYHIKQSKDAEGNVVSEFDNSIRTHGSVDYMSILRRYSHGCHRLYNMDAVRLFAYVLQHRDYGRIGQIPVGVGRHLEADGRSYHMKISTRGYKYELVEPIPVTVTRGRVRGSRSTPIEGYLERPLTEEEKAAQAEAAMEAAGDAVEDVLTPWL